MLKYGGHYSSTLHCYDEIDQIDVRGEKQCDCVGDQDDSSPVNTVDDKKVNQNGPQECSTSVSSVRTYIECDCTYIAYSIGIVDIGGKPTSKIISKLKIEDEICATAERVEKMNIKT